MIEVAGKKSGDVGGNKSQNAYWEAGDNLEENHQKGRELTNETQCSKQTNRTNPQTM